MVATVDVTNVSITNIAAAVAVVIIYVVNVKSVIAATPIVIMVNVMKWTRVMMWTKEKRFVALVKQLPSVICSTRVPNSHTMNAAIVFVDAATRWNLTSESTTMEKMITIAELQREPCFTFATSLSFDASKFHT